MNVRDLRFGYVPSSPDCSAPGDRRRFACWAARRGIAFELADPARAYDIVVVTEAADISVWRRYAGGAKIVYDLIDSYLAIPRTSPKGWLRGSAKFVTRQSRYFEPNYWRTVALMCRRADAVICSTGEQRQDIEKFCANVHIILDIQDGDARAIKAEYRSGTPFRFVWEGQAYTLELLHVVAPVLRRLRSRHDIVLDIVTDPEAKVFLGGRLGHRSSLHVARRLFHDVVLHPWSAETLSRVATAADLAIIPLPLEDPFTNGKPENKLLLFWRMAVPAVASATPAYRRAMDASGVSLTCASEAEWESRLCRCLGDEALRREAGTRGFAYARREHGDDRILERWDRVFASLFEPNRRGPQGDRSVPRQ